MSKACHHCKQRTLSFVALCSAFLNSLLLHEPSLAQTITVPSTLGPQYGRIIQYSKNVTQTDEIKSFNAQKMSAHMYRVKIWVPYEFDEYIELDLLADCSNGRIAGTQGLEVADNRFIAAYYTAIIRRTCK